ncbi:MAG TPA: pyrroloquinoline quinone biosynthesis protein PqqB [Paracoccaceae bacterium]|nr:pyrroloquinoline quinone biosynthesis protein PqqB [Paracoccaceae bacterium]
MEIIVLGAGAGGGLPQWNCGCANCAAARVGHIPAMTQSSVAVSADGERWLLLNASPDIRQQIAAAAALHPRGLRGSPVEAVLLTNGEVDHVAGLLTLRERTPFALYATPEIHAVLREDGIFGVLHPELVARREVEPGRTFRPLPGLSVTLFPVPGKAPLYREGAAPKTGAPGGETVGVAIRAGAARAFYIPGCAAMTPALAARLRGAPLVMFDGTLWRDDEMPAGGTGEKTGARMGHMAMDGPEGSIAALAGLEIAQKVFVHINNTNPVLDPASPERATADAAGWTIAQDGMAFRL